MRVEGCFQAASAHAGGKREEPAETRNHRQRQTRPEPTPVDGFERRRTGDQHGEAQRSGHADRRREMHGARGHQQGFGHCPTRKVKLPSVAWVSTEITCQWTLYSPGVRFLRPTISSVWSRSSTRGAPSSTRAPAASVTSMPLKAGSSSCVNQMRTSAGGAPSVLPTGGAAWSRKACAHATPPRPTTSKQASSIPEIRCVISVSEYRPPEGGGENIVEEEMKLPQPAIAVPGQAVDRDDRLGADLIILPGPDQAGLDGAGGLAALAAIHRRRHGHLDHRDQTVEGRGQPHVLHVMLQIFEAVFDGDAVIEIVGMQHRAVRTVARRLEREVVAKIAGDRKRPQPRQR